MKVSVTYGDAPNFMAISTSLRKLGHKHPIEIYTLLITQHNHTDYLPPPTIPYIAVLSKGYTAI